MPTIDSIITDVLRREGWDKVTNDPSDLGGLTQFGLTKRDNPTEWADGKVTEAEARTRYRKKYVEWPRFDKIPAAYSALQAQIIDYGVNSGPQLAIMKLQALIGAKIDGQLGPKSLAALLDHDPVKINNQLM